MLPGAKPGVMAGTKRKATSNLSTNPNIVRARKRLANMSLAEQAVEQAQNADRQAVRRAQAEQSVRSAMEEEEEARVMEHREKNDCSANYIARQWGFGDNNGSIKTDDEDEEWEEEELDWSELEKHYWEDDIWNDGEAALPTMEMAAAAQQHARSLLQEQTQNLLRDDFEWRHWCAGWVAAVKAFQKKAMKINTNPSLTSCGPPIYILQQNGPGGLSEPDLQQQF